VPLLTRRDAHAFNWLLSGTNKVSAIDLEATGWRPTGYELAQLTNLTVPDDVTLQLRVGVNSGQVIAGEIGSGALGYTTIGEQVGIAQRMESVAPPGEVMLSASTARLVENLTVLGDSETVRIKGSDQPVPARRLLGVAEQGRTRRWESSLVGRQWELGVLAGAMEQAVDGRGCVVGVSGPAGIGKSRLVHEVATIAARRGIDVFAAFCESHTSDVPFHVVTMVLRAASGVTHLDNEAAQAKIRSQIPDAEAQDLLLLDDLLGIGDPTVSIPLIDADERRQRLTALINAALLAHHTTAVYVVEDAHWIDKVSESMLADFIALIPQTHVLVLITYRPEYRGVLARSAGSHTISLAPLNVSQTAELTGELLGSDPSVAGLAAHIAESAAGNPFFAEEMVRELAERGVLEGDRGRYPHQHRRCQRAGYTARDHCGAHRPPQARRQACTERGGGDRIAVRPRSSDRFGGRAGPG
jgi:AAA ATPase domain/Adenylate and Guanylate cyclase catalytic domain